MHELIEIALRLAGLNLAILGGAVLTTPSFHHDPIGYLLIGVGLVLAVAGCEYADYVKSKKSKS